MSPSPSHQPNPSHLRFSSLVVLGTLVVSCASQPQESGKAADSVAATKAPTAAPAVPEKAPAPSLEQSKDSATGAARAEEAVGAVAPAAPNQTAASPGNAERKRGAAPRAATSGGGLAAPKASPGRAPASKSTLDDAEARPAFAEPPELTQALAEFDAQLEALSTTRACDDACRALESMRRSAQRICDLVLDGDPRERCLTARSRLEQASRDLSARCTTCR